MKYNTISMASGGVGVSSSIEDRKSCYTDEEDTVTNKVNL